MSEKPEALDVLQRDPNSNFDNGGAVLLLQSKDAELCRLHAENERLREALELAFSCHGKVLMSDPPQDAWKFHRVNEVIAAALRREETT